LKQYDAVLYGNGLTLSLLQEIEKITTNSIKKYLNCNLFISDLLYADSHKRISREFNKYFTIGFFVPPGLMSDSHLFLWNTTAPHA
jgi:hypothetical protein